MKINFDLLRLELGERLNCEVFGIDRGCGLIESPLFYETGATLLPDRCYLADSYSIADNKDALFIFCGEFTMNPADKYQSSCIQFSFPQSLLHVMNTLQDIFTKYRAWEESLLGSLQESGSLETLLELSVPIFENPIFLIDSGFNVLAVAMPDPPKDFKPPDKVEESWVILGKEELIHAGVVHEPYFRHLPNDYPRMFINLSENGFFIGNLSLQASHRELRESDGYLLGRLAAIIQTVMLRYGTADLKRRDLVENMLLGIIEGRTIDEVEFARITALIGFSPNEHFQVLAIKIPKPSGEDYIRYFLQQLESKIPAIYALSNGDFAVMVFRVSTAEQQGVNVLSILENELNSFGFRVGLSDRYTDLFFTKQYFEQARYALEIGETSREGKSILSFSDCCLDYILENCSGGLKPFMLWTEGFRRLVDHDVNGRASYVETLRAYLDNNQNANKTAEALFITRNSLLSRLERMCHLLGENLEDPKTRFRLELSLLLYDQWS